MSPIRTPGLPGRRASVAHPGRTLCVTRTEDWQPNTMGRPGSPWGDRTGPDAEPEPVPITGALQAAPHGIQVCQVPTRIVLSYLTL
jgi:hypothetical protein